MPYKIAVIPGDGTGPEVVREELKVLNAVADTFSDLRFDFHHYDYGGDWYLSSNRGSDPADVLTEGEVDELSGYDAIILGAIGHPDVPPGILEKGVLLRLRFDLQQYVNLRPVKLYSGVECPLADKGPEDIDFVVVRENNWGLYGGMGGVMFKGTPDEVATQTMLYTRRAVDQCLNFAFNLARKRKNNGYPGKLTHVNKTNVLSYCADLWDRACKEMAKRQYTDVETEYAHVDATCMWMVKNPERFDVIVTPNMFGDIITDLGAMIQGGMGIAAGANINPDPQSVSMFEPIGGSAPKYTGRDVICPLAAIESGRMMLDYLGITYAVKKVQHSVSEFLASGRLKGLSAQAVEEFGGTRAVGDAIAEGL